MENCLIFMTYCILAYLIGSIPTALWMGKILWGIDIRKVGSRNVGATNALRVFGILPALIVLLIDFSKGWIVTSLSNDIEIQFFLVISAIIGHVFSIFSKGKGGKGVATTFGCYFALNPLFILISLTIWIFTFWRCKISSIASLASILGLFVSLIVFNCEIYFFILTVLVTSFIFWTHRENVKRILEGKEGKLF